MYESRNTGRLNTGRGMQNVRIRIGYTGYYAQLTTINLTRN